VVEALAKYEEEEQGVLDDLRDKLKWYGLTEPPEED